MLSIKRNIKVIAIALMLSGMAVVPAHGMFRFLANAPHQMIDFLTGRLEWQLTEAARDGFLWRIESLVKDGCDIDGVGVDGLNALMWAARKGHIDIVDYLLKQGANINAKDANGLNALMWATREGFTDIVKLLLKKAPNLICIRDNNGKTAFWWACEVASNARDKRVFYNIALLLLEHGVEVDVSDIVKSELFMVSDQDKYRMPVEMFDLLLKRGVQLSNIDKLCKKLLGLGENINEKNDLSINLDGGSEGIADFFIKHGANIYKKDEHGYTNFMHAIDSEKLEIAEYLLGRGARIDKEAGSGYTMFETAVSRKKFEMAQWLLNHGANIDRKGALGYTIFMNSIEDNQLEIAEWLLKHGANIDEKARGGNTIFMLTVNAHRKFVAEWLLQHGAKIDVKDNNGYTVLMSAVKDGKFEIAEWLLKHGAKIHKKDRRGYTMFMDVIDAGKFETAEWLLQHGAKIDVKDYNGYTVLMSAVKDGKFEIAELLLQHGAKIDVKAKHGENLLDCALTPMESKNCMEIVALLLKYGVVNEPCQMLHHLAPAPKNTKIVVTQSHCVALATKEALCHAEENAYKLTLEPLEKEDPGMLEFVLGYIRFKDDDKLEAYIQKLSKNNKNSLKRYAPYTCALRACDAGLFKKILQESRKEGETGLGEGFTKEIMRLPVICGNQDKVCILMDSLLEHGVSRISTENQQMLDLQEAIRECPNKKIKRSLQHLMAMKWFMRQHDKDLHFSFKKF